MKVTGKLIKNIVDRICSEIKPQKIIIFGSSASPAAKEAGDVDLLIISDSSAPKKEQIMEIDSLFKDRDFPLDILVYTSKEVHKFQDIKGSLINEILRNGRTVYEKAA